MNLSYLLHQPIFRFRSRGLVEERVLTAMRRAVARAGAEHRSLTHSTSIEDEYGFACIQGEMLREMGYSTAQRAVLPTWSSICDELDPQHIMSGYRLQSALAYAQGANDTQVPWGEILRRVEVELAA